LYTWGYIVEQQQKYRKTKAQGAIFIVKAYPTDEYFGEGSQVNQFSPGPARDAR
jgi:hypothetical protein